MKQIGMPITSFGQGVSLIASFGFLSAFTAYLAYQQQSSIVAIASLIYLLVHVWQLIVPQSIC